jgi:hypothetical protein
VTDHDLTDEDAGDRDMWRNLALAEGNPPHSGEILELMYILFNYFLKRIFLFTYIYVFSIYLLHLLPKNAPLEVKPRDQL